MTTRVWRDGKTKLPIRNDKGELERKRPHTCGANCPQHSAPKQVLEVLEDQTVE